MTIQDKMDKILKRMDKLEKEHVKTNRNILIIAKRIVKFITRG